MPSPTEPEVWLERMRRLNPVFATQEYGLHLQAWLEEQTGDKTGCFLVDSPLVLGNNDDDSV